MLNMEDISHNSRNSNEIGGAKDVFQVWGENSSRNVCNARRVKTGRDESSRRFNQTTLSGRTIAGS